MRTVRLVGLAVLAIGTALPHESIATVGDKRTVTWNLQGSSANSESKWSVNVRAVLLSGVDIMAIQEAGMPPATAELLQVPPRIFNPNSLPVPVTSYRWNLGTRFRSNYFYIHHVHNDRFGANRVNLAIVTRSLPDEIILLRPYGFYPSARPLFGVRFGSDFYYSIHASARGGWDAPHIVRNIMMGSSDRCRALFLAACEVMIMGDYNQAPSTLEAGITTLPGSVNGVAMPNITTHVRVVAQAGSTQRSGGNLDYSVVGIDLNTQISPTSVFAFLQFAAQLVGQLSSDHKPVFFRPRGG